MITSTGIFTNNSLDRLIWDIHHRNSLVELKKELDKREFSKKNWVFPVVVISHLFMFSLSVTLWWSPDSLTTDNFAVLYCLRPFRHLSVLLKIWQPPFHLITGVTPSVAPLNKFLDLCCNWLVTVMTDRWGFYVYKV